MSFWKILIVEDEPLVAKDLQVRLIRMGYDVPAIAPNAADALALVAGVRPDLVLTDIRLETEPDGIELAAQIRAEYDLPLIYITAFADDETLERARLTEPYGYVLKPFHDRELQIAIEIAVYKHKVERELRENRSWLSAVLKSIGDAVIATDAEGLVVFVNPAAEALTDWTQKEARGRHLRLIFNVSMRRKFFGPWFQVSDREYLQTGYFNETILTSRHGKERAVHSTVSHLKDERGKQIGEVVVFQDIAARKTPLLAEIH